MKKYFVQYKFFSFLAFTLFFLMWASSNAGAYQLPYFGEECDVNGISSISPSVFGLGDIVTIEGSGFGNRNLDDGIPETIIVMDGNGASSQIQRTFADVGGEPEYHGILSWTDNQIEIEIPTTLAFTSGYLAARPYVTTESSSSQYICGSPNIEATHWYLTGYEPAPVPPVISDFNSSVFFGDQITINGTDFGTTQGAVLTATQNSLPINSWSDTTIIVNTSNNGVLQAGNNQLIVRTSDGIGSSPFTVLMTQLGTCNETSISSISAEFSGAPAIIGDGDIVTINGSGFGNNGSLTVHDSNNAKALEIHFVSPDGSINKNVTPISLGPSPNFTPITPNLITNFTSNQIQFEMDLSVLSDAELQKFITGGSVQVWNPTYNNGSFGTSVACGQSTNSANFSLTRFSNQSCNYTYSEWSVCSSNSTQTRTLLSTSPNDCTVGTPILSQPCTYTPSACTSWTYSDWGTCSVNGQQSRTIVTSSPEGCAGGTPILSQSCTAIESITTPFIESITNSINSIDDVITITGEGFNFSSTLPGYGPDNPSQNTLYCDGKNMWETIINWDDTSIQFLGDESEIFSNGNEADCYISFQGFYSPSENVDTNYNTNVVTVIGNLDQTNFNCGEWGACINGTRTQSCEALDGPLVGTSFDNTQACTTPTPTITSISPTPIYQGTETTINGYGFGTYGTYGSYCGTCKVLVNNSPATLPYNSSYYYDWSDTSITFNMPQNATSGSIKVVDKNGNTSNSFNFTISTNPLDIPPIITAISPQIITPGDVITIRGSNFGNSQGDSKIATGDFVAGGTIESWSDNEIRYKSSSYYDTKSKKLGIQKCKKSYSCLNAVYGGYFYIQPEITSIDLNDGPVGATLNINGNYFKNENVLSDASTYFYIKVYFNGVEADIMKTRWTSQKLEVTVPYGAKDGNITVEIGSNGTSDHVIATGPYFDVWENMSDDEHSSRQTYFNQINIPKAWAVSGDRRRIIVAVIDDGVYSNHPDLKKNMWLNKDEISGNGIDDDNNGYIDDVNGWNFYDVTPNVTPTGSHGTHVAGIIAAYSNNGIGIAGVNSNVEIMPLIVFGEKDDEGAFDVGSAIKYAVDNGAEVINLSLGTGKDITVSGYSPYYDEFIKYAYDHNVLVVAAAGNGDKFGNGYDLNYQKQSPVCNDGNKNMVIGVGAVDSNNIRTSWSNYGTKCVDILAPGVDIISTSTPDNNTLDSIRGGSYSELSGTSFSAPIVTGIVSLLKAKYPMMTSKDAIELLISSANNGVVDAYETIVKSKDFVPTTTNTISHKENDTDGTAVSINTNNDFSNSTNPFKDLSPSHQNKVAILYLYQEGIISGYPDKTFKPENDVNRAELLKILIEGKGIKPSVDTYKNCFPDVGTDWYAPYVCYAKEQGWIAGYPDGTFKPANTVNKVEALKMLLEVFTVELVNPSTKPFDDVELSEWYVRYVATAKKRGILEETGSIFSPGSFMKRSGISENIYRLLTL